MNRLVALACTLTLAAVIPGCTASRVARDADVVVSGTLLDPAGQAAKSVRVVLVKEIDVGDLLLGFGLVTASLGAACLLDDAPAVCGRARRATTGDDGRFDLRLKGRDVQGSVGNASTFQLTAMLAAATGEALGPTVVARFEVQTEQVALPPLRFWRPQVDVTASRARVGVEWPPLEAAAGPVDGYQVNFFAGPRGQPVWTAHGRSPLSVDPRVLEDTAGTAAVDASASAPGPGTRVRVTYRSGQVNYRGGFGAPPSRGAACTAAAADVAASPLAPCPFTDGDLGTAPVVRVGEAGIPPTEAVVDLARARSIALVVVRGCPGTCEVATSADQQAWPVAGTAMGQAFTVTPPAATSARYVRVRSTTGLDLGRVTEISVW